MFRFTTRVRCFYTSVIQISFPSDFRSTFSDIHVVQVQKNMLIEEHVSLNHGDQRYLHFSYLTCQKEQIRHF